MGKILVFGAMPFALASNMVKSFEKWGWSKIVGVDSGGKVENLPTPTYEEHGRKLKVLKHLLGRLKIRSFAISASFPLLIGIEPITLASLKFLLRTDLSRLRMILKQLQIIRLVPGCSILCW
jgi:hypothetical protein